MREVRTLWFREWLSWEVPLFTLPFVGDVSLRRLTYMVGFAVVGWFAGNYAVLGYGILIPNGFTATLHDTGTSFSYVGHTYKVLNIQDFTQMPSLRIETKFVKLPTPTPTTTATTTTTTTPPWTPPPPTTVPVTFSVLTPALPPDGKAHAINAIVIGSPIPNNYTNNPYFIASITEYTPRVYPNAGTTTSWNWESYAVTAVTLTPMTFFGDYVLVAEFTNLGVVSGTTVPMGFNGQIVDARFGTVTGVIGNFYNFKGTVTYTTTVSGTVTSIPITPKPISVTPLAPVGIVGLLFFPLAVMVLALLRDKLRLDELLGRLLREYRVKSVSYVMSLIGLILLFILT